MNISIRIILSIFAILSCSSLIAQDGSTAYNFLNITNSAHLYGLGGVNISTVESDLTTTDQNPGLLGQEMDNQLTFNYMRYVGGSNFAGVRYGKAIASHGALAVGLQYFGYGSMKGYDELGNYTGNFSPKDIAITATYSYDFNDRLRGGATLKMLASNYEQYSAFAVATDLGINYYNPENDLSLSVVVANLGGQLKKFNESYDRLPIDVRLGWTQSFGTLPIRFSITAWNLTKWNLPYYTVGDGITDSDSEPVKKQSFATNLFRHLIFAADIVPSDKYYISLAYNHKVKTDMSAYHRTIISGFSIGAGLNVNRFAVGLAFAQPHTGATTFMVNLRVNINDFLN
ncbi:MAG: type IX secretion system protein PorQ [Muribaculaceae bacterium]|nr:type IX secretion system protein PorQ [Muribaculaceae bacterium]